MTDRGIATAVNADLAEAEAYREALRGNEIVVLAPNGANRSGPDFVTAFGIGDDLEVLRIIVTDVKSSREGRGKGASGAEYDYVRNGTVFSQFPPEFYNWRARHSDPDARRFRALQERTYANCAL